MYSKKHGLEGVGWHVLKVSTLHACVPGTVLVPTGWYFSSVPSAVGSSRTTTTKEQQEQQRTRTGDKWGANSDCSPLRYLLLSSNHPSASFSLPASDRLLSSSSTFFPILRVEFPGEESAAAAGWFSSLNPLSTSSLFSSRRPSFLLFFR